MLQLTTYHPAGLEKWTRNMRDGIVSFAGREFADRNRIRHTPPQAVLAFTRGRLPDFTARLGAVESDLIRMF